MWGLSGQATSTFPPQLFNDGGVFKSRDVLRDLVAARDGPPQAPHDLAGAGLGQVVGEADLVGLGNGAELLGHPGAKHLDEGTGVTSGTLSLAHHEGE